MKVASGRLVQSGSSCRKNFERKSRESMANSSTLSGHKRQNSSTSIPAAKRLRSITEDELTIDTITDQKLAEVSKKLDSTTNKVDQLLEQFELSLTQSPQLQSQNQKNQNLNGNHNSNGNVNHGFTITSVQRRSTNSNSNGDENDNDENETSNSNGKASKYNFVSFAKSSSHGSLTSTMDNETINGNEKKNNKNNTIGRDNDIRMDGSSEIVIDRENDPAIKNLKINANSLQSILKESSRQRSKKRNNNSNKRVSFDSSVKTEDGFTAHLYSSPQYLIRDGSFLRPKSQEQLEREKRLLRMLGAPESLAGMALPPGLFDEDTEEIYDPETPNDYGAFVHARMRLQEWIQSREQQRQMAQERANFMSLQAEQMLKYSGIDIIDATNMNHDTSVEAKTSNDEPSTRERGRFYESDRGRDRDRDMRDRDGREREREREKEWEKERDRKREKEREKEWDRERERSRDGRDSRDHREKDYYRENRYDRRDSRDSRDSRDDSRYNRDSRERSRDRDREREYDRKYATYASMDTPLPTQSPLEMLHNPQSAVSAMAVNGDTNDDIDLPSSGLEKAMKMLVKQGWKQGEGLGKSKQGLKGCLVPMGGHNTLVSVQDPTPIMRLQNMAQRNNVDPSLKGETVHECQSFGKVEDCIIHVSNKLDIAEEYQVSVFVRFENIESCVMAVQKFHGRYFDGRQVIASFFPIDRYENRDFE